MTQELLDRLDALAETLGTTTEFVFETLTTGHRIHGLMEAAIWLLVAAMLSTFLWATRKRSNVVLDKNGEWLAPTPFLFVRTGIPVILLLFLTLGGASTLTHIFAPEVYALQQLIGLFK